MSVSSFSNHFLHARKVRRKESGFRFIGDQIFIVNARLNNIKPPYEITRSAVGVDNLPNWKASMFWSFFCITFIRRYLTFEIHSPFLSYYLMDLMYYCKKNYQNVKNVNSKQFVKGMQTIYRVEKVGINIHLLSYLSQCVLNLGCLWSYSTFIPEWLNGKLLTLKHGSQAIAAQMANNNSTNNPSWSIFVLTTEIADLCFRGLRFIPSLVTEGSLIAQWMIPCAPT